ncbi:hypothetical protein J6590_082034 [Homalodisca vitripennis]|nr:hypothetical protein J6590_082034 [Homalodisca vitripennis]
MAPDFSTSYTTDCPELAKIDRSAPYNPILSSSVQEEGKTFWIQPCSRRIGAQTLQLDAGTVALAGRGHLILVSVLFGQTRRTSPVDGTHGDPIECQHNRTSSEQPENQVASAERVRPLRTVAAAGKQLVSKQSRSTTWTIQSIQAENINTVTPPPTDKSGRGGKNNRNNVQTEPRLSTNNEIHGKQCRKSEKVVNVDSHHTPPCLQLTSKMLEYITPIKNILL